MVRVVIFWLLEVLHEEPVDQGNCSVSCLKREKARRKNAPGVIRTHGPLLRRKQVAFLVLYLTVRACTFGYRVVF